MSIPIGTDHPTAAPCRALVPTSPDHSFGGGDWPRASFVTQLIASNRRLPACRRTDPDSAATTYAATRPAARASVNVLI